MLNHSLVINLPLSGVMDNASSQLRWEFQNYQQLLQAQPAPIKQQLEAQAKLLSEALDHQAAHVHYYLPEAVYLPSVGLGYETRRLPARFRKQSIGGLTDRLVHRDTLTALLEQLSGLGNSPDPAVSNSAQLLRHALAMYVVRSYLPDGQDVQYHADADDDIPNVPVSWMERSHQLPYSDVHAVAKQVAQAQGENANYSSGAAQANGFFLPQWIVVDDQQGLLVESTQKAESVIEAMERYIFMLNNAVCLAPYMVVDEEYQRKRYGMLGQLVNQGRALARYEVLQICETIQRRAATHALDRGFSLSLPYFNDQTLALELYDFDVIPSGRVMFVPSFVVLSVRAQGAKIIQEARFNRTTRLNLVKELYLIERTFLR